MKRSLPLLVLSLSACAPSVRDLVSHRHYREAVCAASEGAQPAVVRRALLRDLGLQVHAQVVRSSTFDAISAQRAARSPRVLRLLRVDVQSNALPVDEVEIEGALSTDGDSWSVRAATIGNFAQLTRERLPRERVGSTYFTGPNVLRGMAALVTGGLSLLFSPMQRESYTIPPRPDEIARSAPLAWDLALYVHRDGCERSGSGGARCQWYAIVDELATAPLELRLAMRYRADGLGSRRSCSITERVTVALGEVGTLDRTLSARFGERARSLEELSTNATDVAGSR